MPETDPETPSVRPFLSEEALKFGQTVKGYVSQHLVNVILRELCERLPDVLPNYTTWRMGDFDVADVVFKKLQDTSFIAAMHPLVCSMMGDNIGNVEWASKVVIGLTIYQSLLQRIK